MKISPVYTMPFHFISEWRSTETDLRLPLLKTVNGQKAFSYRGAKLWNSLEKEAKLAPSLKTFKERL